MNKLKKNISLINNPNLKIQIGLYIGEGSGNSGIENFANIFLNYKNIEITKLTTQNILEQDLLKFDIITFTGGSGSKQASSLGVSGREKIINYVDNGGNYLGICAGAYLATSCFDWSLGILNAKTISQTEWERGKGMVDIELTKEGEKIFSKKFTNFKVRYSNGPIIEPALRSDLFPYNIIGTYKSEISNNNVTQGVMIDTPAIANGIYGKGKVFIIGPHLEDSKELEIFLLNTVLFLRKK